MSLKVNLGDGSWTPLKGYEGYYWINKQGDISNSKGHILKGKADKDGRKVYELRRLGQRETVFFVNTGGLYNENA